MKNACNISTLLKVKTICSFVFGKKHGVNANHLPSQQKMMWRADFDPLASTFTLVQYSISC